MWEHCEQFTPTGNVLAHVPIRCNDAGDGCTTSVRHFVKSHGLFFPICFFSLPPLPAPAMSVQSNCLCKQLKGEHSSTNSTVDKCVPSSDKLLQWLSMQRSDFMSHLSLSSFPFTEGGTKRRKYNSVITSVFLKKSTGIGLHHLLLRTLSVWLHLRALGKKI